MFLLIRIILPYNLEYLYSTIIQVKDIIYVEQFIMEL